MPPPPPPVTTATAAAYSAGEGGGRDDSYASSSRDYDQQRYRTGNGSVHAGYGERRYSSSEAVSTARSPAPAPPPRQTVTTAPVVASPQPNSVPAVVQPPAQQTVRTGQFSDAAKAPATGAETSTATGAPEQAAASGSVDVLRALPALVASLPTADRFALLEAHRLSVFTSDMRQLYGLQAAAGADAAAQSGAGAAEGKAKAGTTLDTLEQELTEDLTRYRDKLAVSEDSLRRLRRSLGQLFHVMLAAEDKQGVVISDEVVAERVQKLCDAIDLEGESIPKGQRRAFLARILSGTGGVA
jgi:hypothetical protein